MRSAIVTCFSARHGRASSVQRPAPELLPLQCPVVVKQRSTSLSAWETPLSRNLKSRAAQCSFVIYQWCCSGARTHCTLCNSCQVRQRLRAPGTKHRVSVSFLPAIIIVHIREPVSVTHRFIRFALSIDPKAAWLMLLLITRGLSFDSRLRRRRCFLDVAEKISNEK